MYIHPRPGVAIISPIDAIIPSAKVALIKDDCHWTHERFAVEVDRLAAGMLAFGVQARDRVCLHLRNGPEIAVAYFACFRVGAVAVPMNLRFTPGELESVLRRVQPVLYLGQSDLYDRIAGVETSILAGNARFIVGDAKIDGVRPWTDLLGDPAKAPLAGCADPHAPAVLLTTSGTTGQPKFVAHSLDTLTHITARFGHLGFASGHVLAFIMPMAHASGLSMLFAAMRLGVTIVFADGTDADAVLETIEREQCTILVAGPATYAQVMERQQEHPCDVVSLRVCLTSTDVCPAGQQDAFQALFGVPLRSLWASTEALLSLTYGLQTGAVSRLMPGTEMRLVDADGHEVPMGATGEMLLRGPTVMLGYWSGPGSLGGKQDGWYRSGDLMRQDKYGNVWFVSRLNDLIVRGGSNISPVEVEQVLSGHPAVRDAAVIGMPDLLLGQRVLGFVHLNDNVDIATLGDILSSASTRLATYKMPKRLLVMAEIPRNDLGKIDRKQLAVQHMKPIAA